MLLISCMICSSNTYAQFSVNGKGVVYDKRCNTYMVSIPKESFGENYDAVVTLDADSAWTQLQIEGLSVDDGYVFNNVEGNKEYSIKALRGDEPVEAKLTFTFLPILQLTGSFGYDYARGSLSLYTPDDAMPVTSLLKAKWRGGSTNGTDRHKRNYKIKLLKENGKSRDLSLLGMREDNNWILDAGQVDLFRLRNRIATELWNDFASKPYYSADEPKAKSGVDGRVVEVVLNNEYYGIYSLTEAMDRKELKLKKYDENKQEFHGQLWKSSSWDGTTFWNVENDYDNTSETWHGFETKYPDIEDVNPTDYRTLYDASDFVINSDDETFRNEVADYFDIPVLMDYHLLLEVIKPIDNCGKNIYWAVYDKAEDKKLTLAVWDMDASAGQDWQCGNPLHPEYVSPNTNIGVTIKFNLFRRLSTLDADNYNRRLEERYKELSETYFNEDQLIGRYQRYYDVLLACGATLREEQRWSGDSDIGGYELNLNNELSYIKDWIHQRLAYINSASSPILTSVSGVSSVSQHADRKQEVGIYNILGQKVDDSYRGLVIKNGRKIMKQ